MNINNNKVYIGCSSNMSKRIKGHKYRLSRGTHDNELLQKSYNKYGANCFDFIELQECSVECMYSIEHYWCNIFNSHNREMGYNLLKTSNDGSIKHSEETKAKLSKIRKNNPTGCRAKGFKMSEERKAQISIINKGRKPHPRNIQVTRELKSKKVIDSRTGIIYQSTIEVAVIFGLSICYLRRMLRGERRNYTTFQYYNK